MPSSDVAPWVEHLARVGYAAKALLYITIGFLASEAALGRGGRVTDTQGALQVVHRAAFGRIWLVVVAAGLLGYALWRLVQAIVDPERRGTAPKAIALRAGFAIRGLFHGGLGLTALRLALGDGRGAAGDQVRRWTARTLDLPAGGLLVGLAALGIGGYGLYQFYRSWSPKLQRHLQLNGLAEGPRKWALGVSRFGIAARGVVFCMIGFFLARAAWEHNPAEAGGVRESLRALASVGRWPFIVVAFGLVAYGVYELVNARYRSITVG
jgi:hypothetical protein